MISKNPARRSRGPREVVGKITRLLETRRRTDCSTPMQTLLTRLMCGSQGFFPATLYPR